MLKKHLSLLFILCAMLSGETFSQPNQVYIAHTDGVRADVLQNIAPVIEKSIAAKNYPGAVVLIGHRGKVIYRGVFGQRRLIPNAAPMQFDTLFDLASLTKVIATTPAIMQLLEQGKLSLDAPVAKYWPAFGAHGKANITLRELLTHESGLPADLPEPQNAAELYHQIEELTLTPSTEKKFVYSDINFIILAHLVELITHESFDHYTQQHIFTPLGMTHTFFKPAVTFKNQIAPTEIVDGHLRWGQTQDPLANAMGGVAGNAGLFSTAADLGLYAQCLLNGGRITSTLNQTKKNYLLGPLSILKMTTPQTPSTEVNVRGLGWDIDSPYSNRGVLLPVTSFGHTGWTGTSIWIDPTTQTYIIILTSRLHPKPARHNPLIEDRRLIANFVAASLTDISSYTESNTGIGELSRAYQHNS
jgi:CubicO group peptidase (beta-lactamase class C family)